LTQTDYTYMVSISIPITTHNEVDVKDEDVLQEFYMHAKQRLLNGVADVWAKAELIATTACQDDEQPTADGRPQEAVVLGPRTPVEDWVAEFVNSLPEGDA
jgi:hypothetical protein